MTTRTTKDFASLRDDYAFFESHATEAEADLRGYQSSFPAVRHRSGLVRMLDFGCGSGSFSQRLLEQLAIPPERLRLALVEPVAAYQQEALQRLASFTRQPVETWAELPSNLPSQFDLILANHVFYYVPDLETVVPRLLDALAPSGLLLTAMAGQRNTLIQFWNRCFAMIGRPVPYHTAEDFEAVLSRNPRPFWKQDIHYVLSFSDTEAHRLKILRFLLGNYFNAGPRQAMLNLFEPFTRGGTIVIPIVHEQYVIGRD